MVVEGAIGFSVRRESGCQLQLGLRRSPVVFTLKSETGIKRQLVSLVLDLSVEFQLYSLLLGLSISLRRQDNTKD